jgi:hypothetical protein
MATRHRLLFAECCGLEITVDDNENIVGVRGDRKTP